MVDEGYDNNLFNLKKFKEFIKKIFLENKIESVLDYGSGNTNWFDKNFDENINIFNTDLPVFVYCLSGGRSSQANEKIKSLGFKNVYELNGGILEWRKSKFPEAIFVTIVS